MVNTFIMKSPFLNDQWLAYFGDVFPVPKYVVNHWMDDTEFARNYITGENPFEIQVSCAGRCCLKVWLYLVL